MPARTRSANAKTAKAATDTAAKPAKVAKAGSKQRNAAGANPAGQPILPDPAAAVEGSVHADPQPWDVKLVSVDVAKNSDKFYIVQLIDCDDGRFAVFTRWGATGTQGTSKCELFKANQEVKAKLKFHIIFKQKTGQEWEDRDTYQPKDGKYAWVSMDESKVAPLRADNAQWQYWVDDNVDGKEDGWYDYDEDGSRETETLYYEFLCNVNLYQRVAVRSGNFSYLIDLPNMTQMNVTHPNNKVRHIRRWNAAMGDDQTPPGAASAKPKVGKKRRAAAAAAAPAAPASRKKVAKTAPKAAAAPPAMVALGSAGGFAVDPACYLPGAEVHEEFSVMLNQTNVGANNNKFYRLQLLTSPSGWHVWTHWGRVGEAGQTQSHDFSDEAAALKKFKSQFRAKTMNSWDERADFEHVQGKYDIVEVEEGGDDQAAKLAGASASCVKEEAQPDVTSLPCSLDGDTASLVELIFNEDMFKDTMAHFDLDVNKMPLGNLTQAQVQKGYDVLVDLQAAIQASNRKEVERLTGRFYTTIPHSFGRRAPPLINTEDALKEKFEMCDVLADIETAQGLKGKEGAVKEEPDVDACAKKHRLDELYEGLGAQLELLPAAHEEHKVARKYFEQTKQGRGGVKLLNVWKVASRKEDGPFQQFADLDNHRLLWHGTRVAVVAAILNGGLRIMPHSGGRCGKGIYLASAHSKSAGYVGSTRHGGKNVAVMFLVQAALGKPAYIKQDDSSLTKPPKGHHSVIAVGAVEPSPKSDVKVKIENVDVSVAQSPPIDLTGDSGSSTSFQHSEYLIYNEGQQRLRYVLTFQWAY